jgi:hypothetical protein
VKILASTVVLLFAMPNNIYKDLVASGPVLLFASPRYFSAGESRPAGGNKYTLVT